MLIKAYSVESHRASLADGNPPSPVPIGVVQFTGPGYVDITESRLRSEAVDVLIEHSPLLDHRGIGSQTWAAELISVDDDSLGPPFFEDAQKGLRVWLFEGLA